MVEPYLQAVEETSALVLWETRADADPRVLWGPTEQLDREAQGTSQKTDGAHRLHTVELRGLRPDTRYFYRVLVAGRPGPMHALRTKPSAGTRAPFRVLAMSDMQHDQKRPTQLRQIVEGSVLPLIARTLRAPPEDAIALVLAPGDLMTHGLDYERWPSQLFGPMRQLLAHVPMLPALGNHDEDSPHYFRYFVLPDNGYGEHWWYTDHVDVRIIGLDTNTGYRTDAQLRWLAQVLDDACHDDTLDFVFAEYHHPEHSELWPRADTPYSGQISRQLEAFAERCGKPALSLFGHTHAYARGHSPFAAHTTLSVASAGGDLDYVGEYDGVDLPEYPVSQDEYGYVMLDVEPGPEPRVHVRRYSLGNAQLARRSELRDRFTLRRYDRAPATPRVVWPDGEAVSPGCAALQLAPFADADGDAELTTQVQLAGPSCDFAAPALDRLLPRADLRSGIDSQRLRAPGFVPLGALTPGEAYCARVRVRDTALAWSAWSEPRRFRVGDEAPASCTQMPLCNPLRPGHNLLQNAGAEEGTTAFRGAIESLSSGQCDSVPAYTGARLFAVGGVCGPKSARGEAVQRIDLRPDHAWVARGLASMRFGGYLRSFDGRDRPSMNLVFRDAGGRVLRRSFALTNATAAWRKVEGRVEVPAQATSAELVLRGERGYGDDNDSYFDALYVTLASTRDGQCGP